MGVAKRKVTEPEDDGLAAAMARLEALAAEMGEQPERDGPTHTVEQALRLLGIDLPEDNQ
ncbi:MAG: hypothetical protein HQL42_11200 [Alphaproteobacteria bacterium]|nr:hypothetical protein [Alphaproteobacteria bacterium]